MVSQAPTARFEMLMGHAQTSLSGCVATLLSTSESSVRSGLQTLIILQSMQDSQRELHVILQCIRITSSISVHSTTLP